MADDATEARLRCYAAGVRTRDHLQRLADTTEKLVALTTPGEHDPAEVAAREHELHGLVGEVGRDAEDAAACGIVDRGETRKKWETYWAPARTMLDTADPHARYVGFRDRLDYLVKNAGWEARDTQRPGGSPPQGQVTLRMGPSGSVLYPVATEEDLREAETFSKFFSGEAEREPGVEIATHLYRDGDLEPSLSDALAHLRSTLAAVTAGTDAQILITYDTGTNESHHLAVSGYGDPYRGYIWNVSVTRAYTAQNQREIADYVRHYEDAIAEEVRRLAPRKRRSAGYEVDFWRDHPGLTQAEHIEVGPPEGGRSYSYMLPDFHPPGTYTPPDFSMPRSKP